jgi:hypothetical protein
MIRCAVLAILVFGFSVMASHSALSAGCDGSLILKQDYDHPPANWKPPGPEIAAVDGKLQLSPRADESVAIPVPLKGASTFDVCVTTRLVGGDGSYIGFALSGSKSGPDLVFSVNRSGDVAVTLHDWKDDKWTEVRSPRNDPVVHRGPGAENRLRLLVNDSESTFYVNDKSLAVVLNTVGSGTSKLGIEAVSGKGGVSKWTIDDLVVSEPVEAPVAEAKYPRCRQTSSRFTTICLSRSLGLRDTP